MLKHRSVNTFNNEVIVSINKAEAIMKKYDFIKPEKGPQHTLMCFGFECGEGWYSIIEKLFEDIKKLNPSKDFEIIQVKEKWGGLRVYTNYTTDEIEKLINEAEEESFKTCETCGEAGERSTKGGWTKTICSNCKKII